MEYTPIRISDLIRLINKDLFLPAIQREFVWTAEKVARLFDSIMADFPIGSFLFWRLEQQNKHEWPVYEFIRDFNVDLPHNPPASMAGVNTDIMLALDGQQRITSLFIGLRGSLRFFYYRHRDTKLYLNLLKSAVPDDDDPEKLTYGFSFRENDQSDDCAPELWYRVGRILDFEDAEDAKADVKAQLSLLSEEQRDNANRLIGRLHNRVHTTLIGNYYLEKSQDYDKVLQVFVRANSAGTTLEYSDLLLATATAKWESLDARKEIHDFTDSLNRIGTGYRFDKDFVLKACLYLSDGLPIQYKVKNFSKTNLAVIETNWPRIKESLSTAVRLISRYGFTSKNVVSDRALLPIAFFILKSGNFSFDTSSEAEDAAAQISIRRWFIFSTLKNAFGSASDTILTRLRDILTLASGESFPENELFKSLAIEPSFNEAEIDRILESPYQGRYTNLVLSLLYPDRDWKDSVFHEDHIFPQTGFQVRSLKKRGYSEDKVDLYVKVFNLLPNLQLLTESENLSKNATPFDTWLKTRDSRFKKRHLIPDMPSYDLDFFDRFALERTETIRAALKAL